MVQIAGDFGGEYFKEGYFEPLDSYIEADGLQDAWADSVMGGLTYDGKVYAAPLTFNSGFIFYNKTMFEENNVPLPTNDWTEEDFIKAAQALTKGEGQDKTWGIDMTSWWAYSLARNLYDGYKAWDWETGTMTADTQGYRDGVQFMTDLYQKYQVITGNIITAYDLIVKALKHLIIHQFRSSDPVKQTMSCRLIRSTFSKGHIQKVLPRNS